MNLCPCGTCEPVREMVPPRPWFWWVALGIAACLFGIEFWLIYRTVAGWPVDWPLFQTIFQRIAG